jgi:hypothetical protein
MLICTLSVLAPSYRDRVYSIANLKEGFADVYILNSKLQRREAAMRCHASDRCQQALWGVSQNSFFLRLALAA